MFVYSDAPPPVCGSGLGSFHWFSTKAELVSFIRDYLAWWSPAQSAMEPEDIAAEVRAIVESHSDALPAMVVCLNTFMRNMWQIEWHGRFRDLCEGADEFPSTVRASFFDDDEPTGTSLPQNRLAEFTEYLQAYGF